MSSSSNLFAGDPVWACLALATDISKAIDSTQSEAHAAIDLAELKGTVNSVRATVVPFLTNKPNDPAFDVCLQGIRDSLNEINNDLKTSAELSAVDSAAILQAKIQVYRKDLLLKQKLDQMASLFSAVETLHGAKGISDLQGRQFWTRTFGETTLIVPWKTFWTALETFFTTTPVAEHEKSISDFLDFTRDGFVTTFEFSTFLKWFGPLQGCLQRLLEPLEAGLLSGFIPACEASAELVHKRIGTFLIRFSKTLPGSFAVTFVDSNNRIKHCLLHHVEPCGMTLKNPPDVYRSLREFAGSHTAKLKFPLGSKWVPAEITHTDIEIPEVRSGASSSSSSAAATASTTTPSGKSADDSGPLQKDPAEKDICIVCMDAPLETVFLECGHVCCCKSCAKLLKACPVCRRPIVRVVPIFRP